MTRFLRHPLLGYFVYTVPLNRVHIDERDHKFIRSRFVIVSYAAIPVVYLKILVKVIWQKVASPPHTNGSVVFARWRQYSPHLIHGSLGSLESTFQTTSRSVQPFCRARDCDRQTDRQRDHATPSVTVGRIYVILWCGLKRILLGDILKDTYRKL